MKTSDPNFRLSSLKVDDVWVASIAKEGESVKVYRPSGSGEDRMKILEILTILHSSKVPPSLRGERELNLWVKDTFLVVFLKP
jgi:hypothetical protein